MPIRFADRVDAGQLLSRALEAEFKGSPDAIVVALPRGGVPVAFPIAKNLGLPLDIVVPRKIGAPYNEEFAIGAITENKEGYFNEDIIRQLRIPRHYIEAEVEKQAKEAQRRLKVYRGDKLPANFENKTVIVVDDGIATGATMKAAIMSLRRRHPKQLISLCFGISYLYSGGIPFDSLHVLAVPVAPADTLSELKEIADRVVCLFTPYPFYAVGNFYTNFSQTEDGEVLELMQKANMFKVSSNSEEPGKAN